MSDNTHPDETPETFAEWCAAIYDWIDGRGWVLATENTILNGGGSASGNINIAPPDYPKVGNYTLLMSHGLPVRHIEHSVFNRRVKRGDNG